MFGEQAVVFWLADDGKARIHVATFAEYLTLTYDLISRHAFASKHLNGERVLPLLLTITFFENNTVDFAVAHIFWAAV